ncbi:toxin-antitoxin system YwqK family antitoxin [Marinilabilia salmonicolor]|jgi:hypothetical protein|uniref:MORN repeat protein n=1 Tax=Marinilabilia salmonicolor TaxID=989 RepID=A0A368V8L8_9BACT|nr:hypothetical protein [Marinilabilia salmonicolor]RCW36615.1 hypothetical protein DFO77_10857 [Marinilabilia salmonicolor]
MQMIKFFCCCFVALFVFESCFNSNSKKEDNSVYQKIEKLDGQGVYEVTYTEDGQISAIKSFTNDTLNGFSYSFHENGNVYEKAEFKNGKRIGHNLIYNEDGMLAFYRYFIKPGKLVFRRAYQNGNVVKEDGGFIVLEPLGISQEQGDSLLSIHITTIIPPDCYNVTTDIEVIDEKHNILDSVQLIDQEVFVYDMQLNNTVRTVLVKCNLYESLLDSVTIVHREYAMNNMLKILAGEKDFLYKHN